jgi:WD40 repeat protein
VGHTGPVNAAAISRDGRWLISGSADRTVRVWTLPSGQLIRCYESCPDDVKAVAFLGNGEFAVAGTVGGALSVWSTASGHDIARFTMDAHVGDLVVLDDDGAIVVGDGLGQVSVLRLANMPAGGR